MTAPAVPRPTTAPQLAEHLTATLTTVLAAHLERARPWYPHEYVPWHLAADRDDPARATLLPEPVRVAVVLNLLTEDNLPGYHGEIQRIYSGLGGRAATEGEQVWRTWLDRWTAEEGRHAIALRDWLTVTGSVDATALEDDRMATVSAGFRADDKDVLRTLAYVSFQELATRVAHRSTGRLSGDESLEKLLARIAADENLHMVVYRELVSAALEVEPTATLTAIVAEIAGFAMPGTGVPGFVRRAAVVARAGIYDMAVHRDQVVTPLVRHWQLLERPLPPEAEPVREQLVAVLAEIDRRADKQLSRRKTVAA